MLKNILIVFIFTITIISCKSESAAQNGKPETVSSGIKKDFSIPEGWILFPKPKENSREMQCANYSQTEWKVAAENGNLKISKYTDDKDEQFKKLPLELRNIVLKNRNIGKGLGGYLHVEPFDNGWLIGSDAGEWGGKLFWFNEDETRKTEILQDNIRGLATIDGATFVLSGMAHESIDEGKIYKLTKDEKGNLKTQLVSDLKTQPQTFAVENDKSILITLNDKIIRLKSSGETEHLSQTNFSSLFPNSMAIDSSNIIYVGMRLFVVRFAPQENGYKEEWLVTQNCRKFSEKNFDCVCQN